MKNVYLNLPFQSIVSIETDSPRLIQNLALRYGAYLHFGASLSAELSVSVAQEKDAYWVQTPQDAFLTNQPLSEIDRYIFQNNQYHTDVFALHGGAVEWNNQCHLFLAPTTSGKTTLTAFLTAHDFGYLTDDCILMDRATLCIHPCSTPIQLRDGGLEVLKKHQLLPPHVTLLEEPPSLRRFIYTPSHLIRQPVPLKSIYFIQRNEEENRLVPMTTVERITELMKAPITQYPITGDYLRFLSRLAKMNCFRLLYKDMNYVKELIQNESQSPT